TVRVHGNDISHRLHISKVGQTDEGRYECRVTSANYAELLEYKALAYLRVTRPARPRGGRPLNKTSPLHLTDKKPRRGRRRRRLGPAPRQPREPAPGAYLTPADHARLGAETQPRFRYEDNHQPWICCPARCLRCDERLCQGVTDHKNFSHRLQEMQSSFH
ncbi:hypothetical protein ANANG_G00170370, partial [Anguilla anguilla]